MKNTQHFQTPAETQAEKCLFETISFFPLSCLRPLFVRNPFSTQNVTLQRAYTILCFFFAVISKYFVTLLSFVFISLSKCKTSWNGSVFMLCALLFFDDLSKTLTWMRLRYCLSIGVTASFTSDHTIFIASEPYISDAVAVSSKRWRSQGCLFHPLHVHTSTTSAISVIKKNRRLVPEQRKKEWKEKECVCFAQWWNFPSGKLKASWSLLIAS